METQWFKDQARKAGKTTEDLARAIGRDRAVVSRILNGRQRLQPEQAEAFARELEVPLEEVLAHAGVFSTTAARRVATGGFLDSDAAPVTGDGGAGRIAAALGPGELWRVKSPAMALAGLLPGDYLLVDAAAAERCRAGDTVLAEVHDRTAAAAVTVLRRYEPPVLVAASLDPDDRRVHVVDGSNVVIRGKVISSWRTT